jgi:hypothetical protein
MYKSAQTAAIILPPSWTRPCLRAMSRKTCISCARLFMASAPNTRLKVGRAHMRDLLF